MTITRIYWEDGKGWVKCDYCGKSVLTKDSIFYTNTGKISCKSCRDKALRSDKKLGRSNKAIKNLKEMI